MQVLVSKKPVMRLGMRAVEVILSVAFLTACSVPEQPSEEKDGERPPTAAAASAAKSPSPSPAEASPTPTEPVVHPPHQAAVLLFEENLELARRERFTGGPENYRNQVTGLAQLLHQQGIAARVLDVAPYATHIADLQQYQALYIVNTFVIHAELLELFEAYVESGGVLVGICETGRMQGNTWMSTWPFGELFGLVTRPVDEWETGVTFSPHGLYRIAKRVHDTSPLLNGLDPIVHWGHKATKVWATQSQGAEVHAVFTNYLAATPQTDAPQVVNEPLPALTVHRLGRGVAIFLACLPTGPHDASWADTEDTGQVLANAFHYASDTLVRVDEQPEWTLGYNQVAYAPDAAKRAVLRLRMVAPGDVECRFILRDGPHRVLHEESCEPWEDDVWASQYRIADFSALDQPGTYQLSLHLPTLERDADVELAVRNGVLTNEIVRSQTHFLRQMRCGERCHLQDPIRGGYHDATGDWAVRMWSMPHVVYGLTRYLEYDPRHAGMREELAWALSWCLQMQGPDGVVYASVKPVDDVSPIHARPRYDESVRVVEKRSSFNYAATYAAALARAGRFLRAGGEPRAASCVRAAARAFTTIAEERVASTGDLGSRAWAAIELYKATRDTGFLDAARADVSRYLPRQLPRGRVRDATVYGDFFADPVMQSFSPQQWKVFHQIGIYLSLIELEKELPPSDPLRENVSAALDDFMEGYVLGMSSLSPYGQMALGLEPTGDGYFRVFHFSHMGSWVRDHGLNCDLLAMAMLAVEREGNADDPRFIDMARRQIDWLLGNNPLGYCMLDGFGERVAPLPSDDLGTGRIEGGIPNGIVGSGDANMPTWGPSWGSREYWLPHNAYLIALIASLQEATAAAHAGKSERAGTDAANAL